MHDLTAFQRDLLYAISCHDRPHGVKIREHLESYYPEDINNGRLYPNLNELVEKGLVDKGSIDDRTNCYLLSQAGRQKLLARRQWENQRLPERHPATP
jgi:DNA-binding PadR family transcriptional regulator